MGEKENNMNLLAASSWILDVVFFALILLGIFLGVARGFVKGICKIAGTIFSIVVALCFCVPLHNSLEKWFSMTTAIANGIKNATVADWLSVAISFVILIIVVRLGAWILGKVGTALVNRFGAFRFVNRVLGGVLGLAEVFLFICILLTIFYWLNLPGVNAYIGSSYVVGRIYEWKWFLWAMRIPSLAIRV